MRAIDAGQIMVEMCRQTHARAPDTQALMKLVYLAHGWHLAILDLPLLDETIEAWGYGVAVPSLYRAIRPLGLTEVTRVPGAKPVALNPMTRDVLRQVAEKYGHWSGQTLSTLTHAPGSPWAVVRDLVPDRNSPLCNAQLTDHFRRHLFDARQPQVPSSTPPPPCAVLPFPSRPR